MSFESLRKILVSHVKVGSGIKDLRIAHVFEVVRSLFEAEWGVEKALLIKPISFRDGVLKLETSSSSAKQEMTVHKVRLRNELNRRLGSLLVREIVVSLR